MTQTAERAFGCVNNTIRLRSGHYFDLADPKPDDFELSDIAGALSKICRFGGQINEFYSVAEHCVHCSRQAEMDGLNIAHQIAALLHDAPEAFCGDVVKPLKVMLRDYDAIEERIERAIGKRFGLATLTSPVVKEIDRAMLIAERRALFSADTTLWTGERSVRVVHPAIGPWSPPRAEQEFVKRCVELSLFVPVKEATS